jgi:hypothetical protein
MTPFKALLVGTALFLASHTAAGAQEPLFDLGPAVDVQDPEQGLIARYRLRLNPQVLQRGEGADIEMALPDARLRALLRPQSPRDILLEDDTSVWTGRAFDPNEDEATARGDVYVMRRGEFLSVRVTFRNRIFVARSADGLTGILEEYEPIERDHPEGVAPPAEPPTPKIGDIRPDSACTDTPDRVDIMVLYTEDAKEAASTAIGAPSTSSAAIENEVAFALSQANFALSNSSAFHRYNLVRIDQVTYDEAASGGASTALLDNLRMPSDMVMDNIHGWRDAVKADLVSLVTAGGDCGWGNTVETANADTTDHRAFSVLRRSCLNTNFSLGHETGHNMGALHDRANSGPSSLTPPFNFAHQQPTPSDPAVTPWRTMMAYGCSGTACPRVTQFSNPDLDFPSVNGDPSGVPLSEPEPEHNVAVFAQNDDAVSRYRCAKTDLEIANVWSKDTWTDTGLEPDPATVGEPMWRSPYIWVRNAQDSTLEHEHEHENPDIGKSPHVYVKFHNDGNLSETGGVELYFADASTALNDPSNWTLLSSQSATINTGVDVFEFPWNSLPGTGHYCLLARWNNTGTPLSFTNIDTYVRNEGGHIWRNVNIVDTGLDEPDQPNLFLVRGVDTAEETFLRIETQPIDTQNIPWGEIASAHITLDADALGEDLLLIGVEQRPDGFRVPLDERVKVIGPLQLKPSKIGKGFVRIDRDMDAVKEISKTLGMPAHYRVSVQQVAAAGVKGPAVPQPGKPFPANLIYGGVDYTLRIPAAKEG